MMFVASVFSTGFFVYKMASEIRCQKICHLRIPEPPSNQIWLAYVYLSEPIYFCNFVMADPVVVNIYFVF